MEKDTAPRPIEPTIEAAAQSVTKKIREVLGDGGLETVFLAALEKAEQKILNETPDVVMQQVGVMNFLVAEAILSLPDVTDDRATIGALRAKLTSVFRNVPNGFWDNAMTKFDAKQK